MACSDSCTLCNDMISLFYELSYLRLEEIILPLLELSYLRLEEIIPKILPIILFFIPNRFTYYS